MTIFGRIAVLGTSALAIWIDSAIAELSVPPLTTLVGAPEDQRRAAVASNGRDFFVVWDDYRNYEPTGIHIYGTRVSASGQVLDSNGIAIATSEAWEQRLPAVASDGTNYLVVWNDYREGSSIYAARVGPSGQVIDPGGFRVLRWLPISNPSVSFNGTDFLVVMTVFRSYPHNAYALIGIRVSPAGQVRDPDGLVFVDGWASGSSVASLNGNWFVAWWDGSNLRGRIVGADGTVSSPQIISDVPSAFSPRVAALGTNYLVTWTRAIYAPPPQPWSSAVLATVVSAEGLPLRTTMIATNSGGVLQEDPAIAAGGDGECFVAWEQGTFYITGVGYCAYSSDILGARVSSEGAVLAPVAINRFGQEQSQPAVAFNGSSFLVVWEDARSAPPTLCEAWTYRDIYGARVSTNGEVMEPEGFLISAEVSGVPTLTWPRPADIPYGMALGSNQLNATANMLGTFAYQPGVGALLNLGTHVLTVTFTPRRGTNVATTNVTLHVRLAPLTVTADDRFMVQGQRVAPLTASYAGFVPGDTPDNLDSPVVITTSATAESPPGTYPIQPSGASHTNYAITFVPGTLTVLPAPNVPPVPGSVDITFDASANGQLIGVEEAESVTVVSIAVDAEGKVLFAADAYAGSFPEGFPVRTVVRLYSDGRRDSSFRGYWNELREDARLNTLALLPDGKVLVGGKLLPGIGPYGGLFSPMAWLRPDGRLDRLLHPDRGWGGEEVHCLAVQPDQRILLGGYLFLSYTPGIARINANGSVDSSFAHSTTEFTGNVVKTIALQPDSKILIGGWYEPKLARLNPNGSLDQSFNAPWITSSVVNALAITPDGKVIAGGLFNAGQPGASSVVRLHADGSRDTNFASLTLDGQLLVLVLQADGKVLAGGEFPGIVRFNQDGTRDTNFQTNFEYGDASPLTRAITVQPDGAILVGGNFTSVNDYPMRGLVRLRSDAQLAGRELAEAVDAPHLAWSTGGSSDWFAQSQITHDGQDAAQSGSLIFQQSNWIATSVTGPGRLTFWWKTICNADFDQFAFRLDDVVVTNIAGEPPWQRVVVDIPMGVHQVRWQFHANAEALPNYGAWLDEVHFAPEGLLIIWEEPRSQLVYRGETAVLEVVATGIGTLRYQWRFNGADLPDATSASLVLANVTDAHAGIYSVVVSDDLGSVTSSSARLEVQVSLAQALDTTGLEWRTSDHRPWIGQTNVTHDGEDAATGSGVDCSDYSYLETTVEGPGMVNFWWKSLAGQARFFLINSDGNWDTWTYLPENADWRPAILAFGPGQTTLRWESHGICGGFGGLGRAWVDQVIVASVGRESAPMWITQPQSQSLPAGTNVTFEAVVVAYPFPVFQWSFNGETIPKATNATFSLSNIQPERAGTYTVLVSNQLGTLTASVTLEVQGSTPRILVQPVSQTVVLGRTISLVVIAQGTDPISYRWRFNGTDVPAGNGASLMLSSVTSEVTGFYSVVLSNAEGVVTSELAQVTIVPIVPWGSTFTVPHETTNIVAVSVGGDHSLALRRDGTVVDWGWRDRVYPDWTNVVAIDAGGAQAIVLKRDGTVGVTGSCGDLQCEIPPGLSNVVAVASGDRHNLALTADGQVVAWGRDYWVHTPYPSHATGLVDIDAGVFHNVGLRHDGTVIAWGYDGVGQTRVPAGLNDAVAIAAGHHHSLALRANGRVVAWGSSDGGALNVPSDLNSVVAVAAGYQYSLALKSDGTVVRWGSNHVPLPAGLSNVVAVASSTWHSVALLGPPMLGVRPVRLLRFIHPTYNSYSFSLWVPTAHGQTYFLEATDTLAPPAWRLLLLVPGDGSVRELTDLGAWVPRRFYRARFVP